MLILLLFTQISILLGYMYMKYVVNISFNLISENAWWKKKGNWYKYVFDICSRDEWYFFSKSQSKNQKKCAYVLVLLLFRILKLINECQITTNRFKKFLLKCKCEFDKFHYSRYCCRLMFSVSPLRWRKWPWGYSAQRAGTCAKSWLGLHLFA